MPLALQPAPPERRVARAIPREVSMNKLEAAYWSDLALLKAAGEIQDFWFEAVKLRLGDGAFYRPDFMVVNKLGEIEMHECKGGFWREAARVRIKVAAGMYPFRFCAVQRKQGAWSYEEF